eukprot:6695351-Alexandrium_andersonii.AAC.1
MRARRNDLNQQSWGCAPAQREAAKREMRERCQLQAALVAKAAVAKQARRRRGGRPRQVGAGFSRACLLRASRERTLLKSECWAGACGPRLG